jgi:hypothetical protein
VHFFSGFSLQNETELFSDYLRYDAHTVAGFSKGAIEAFRYVCETKVRVDRLQLLSPAFFCDKDEAFKRAQLYYFRKDPKNYIDTFLRNIAYPSKKDLHTYLEPEGEDALEMLLRFSWPKEELNMLVESGVEIEVYLGQKDRIIDTKSAYDYFLPYATIYFLKGKGHILDG